MSFLLSNLEEKSGKSINNENITETNLGRYIGHSENAYMRGNAYESI